LESISLIFLTFLNYQTKTSRNKTQKPIQETSLREGESNFRRTGEPFVSDDLVIPTSGPLMVPFSVATTFASSDAFWLRTNVSVSL
jgi:hypothetical protein